MTKDEKKERAQIEIERFKKHLQMDKAVTDDTNYHHHHYTRFDYTHKF